VMTDQLVGATAGLSSSASTKNTAGQASSGTQTIIPLCHMPRKRTELLRTDIKPASDTYPRPGVLIPTNQTKILAIAMSL
jgi:hypothetical protein